VLHRTSLRSREEDLHPVTGGEAISLLSRLTRESWRTAGLDEPTSSREETPYRFVPWPPR